MEENRLRSLLEGECESILQDARMARSEQDIKGAMVRLNNYHRILMAEKEYDLKAEKQTEDLAFRRQEMELKNNAQSDEYFFKNNELQLKKEDQTVKLAQNKEEKLYRYIGYGITVFGLLLEFGGTWFWSGRFLKFEETGAFTARTPQFTSNIKRLFRK